MKMGCTSLFELDKYEQTRHKRPEAEPFSYNKSANKADNAERYCKTSGFQSSTAESGSVPRYKFTRVVSAMLRSNVGHSFLFNPDSIIYCIFFGLV